MLLVCLSWCVFRQRTSNPLTKNTLSPSQRQNQSQKHEQLRTGEEMLTSISPLSSCPSAASSNSFTERATLLMSSMVGDPYLSVNCAPHGAGQRARTVASQLGSFPRLAWGDNVALLAVITMKYIICYKYMCTAHILYDMAHR